MLQKILAAVKTKAFIINAAVIGILAVAACSIPVIVSALKPVPDNMYGITPAELCTEKCTDPFRSYKHMWALSVSGENPESWTEIYAAFEKDESVITCQFKNAPEGAKLKITGGGIAYVGNGVFTAYIKYKNYTTTIYI